MKTLFVHKTVLQFALTMKKKKGKGGVIFIPIGTLSPPAPRNGRLFQTPVKGCPSRFFGKRENGAMREVMTRVARTLKSLSKRLILEERRQGAWSSLLQKLPVAQVRKGSTCGERHEV